MLNGSNQIAVDHNIYSKPERNMWKYIFFFLYKSRRNIFHKSKQLLGMQAVSHYTFKEDVLNLEISNVLSSQICSRTICFRYCIRRFCNIIKPQQERIANASYCIYQRVFNVFQRTRLPRRRMIWLLLTHAPPPLKPASSLFFSLLTERGKEPNHTTTRKPVRCNLLNTLCCIQTGDGHEERCPARMTTTHAGQWSSRFVSLSFLYSVYAAPSE